MSRKPGEKVSNPDTKACSGGIKCCDAMQVELTMLGLQLVEQLVCGQSVMLVR